jgi:hypothetical protein
MYSVSSPVKYARFIKKEQMNSHFGYRLFKTVVYTLMVEMRAMSAARFLNLCA